MRDFEYIKAKSVKQALSLLEAHRGEAKIIAGGQSLLTLMRQGLARPAWLVDIKDLDELDYITFDPQNGLRFGAMTTHRALELSPLIKERYPVLGEMEQAVGSVQTRNWGTIGGTLAHADPIGDVAPPLLALGGSVKILNSQGERVVPLPEFFVDYYMTVVAEDEILTEIQAPPPPPHTGVAYMKFSSIEAGIKIAATAVSLTLGSDNKTCQDAKIVLSAVAPTPFIAGGATALLAGQPVTDSLIEQAAAKAASESDPSSDVHASAEYRRKLVAVLVKRTLHKAVERARERRQP